MTGRQDTAPLTQLVRGVSGGGARPGHHLLAGLVVVVTLQQQQHYNNNSSNNSNNSLGAARVTSQTPVSSRVTVSAARVTQLQY